MDRARDQLLPGPRLAVDQHRRIRGRHGLGIPQHTAQHRALADDFFEVPLVSHFVPQVDSFLGELVLQAANLAIGQGVVHGDRDLIGDLQQEADLVVRVGVVIASTQPERAEDAVTAEERKDAADGEPWIELRIELEPALERVRGPAYPGFPGAKDMRADGDLAVHRLVPLEDVATPRAVERVGSKMPTVGVRQRDDRRVGSHDSPRAPHHRFQDAPEIEVGHQRIRQLEQERQPIVPLA